MENNKPLIYEIKYPFFSKRIGLSGSTSITPIIITSDESNLSEVNEGTETKNRVNLQIREKNGELIEDLAVGSLVTPKIFHWSGSIYDAEGGFTNKLKSALIDEMCKEKLYGYIYHTPLLHFTKEDVVQLYNSNTFSENLNVKEVAVKMLPTITCSFCKKEIILAFDPYICQCGMKYDFEGEPLNQPCDGCVFGDSSNQENSFIELPFPGEETECEKCGRIYTDVGPKQESCCLCQEDSVSIFNPVSTCDHCGLEYDPDGEPIGEFPDMGVYVGEGEIGVMGNCSMVEVYTNYNGNETWTVYHHPGHPGAVFESDSLDIEELISSLKGYGFTLKTISQSQIENFAEALKRIEK